MSAGQPALVGRAGPAFSRRHRSRRHMPASKDRSRPHQAPLPVGRLTRHLGCALLNPAVPERLVCAGQNGNRHNPPFFALSSLSLETGRLRPLLETADHSPGGSCLGKLRSLRGVYPRRAHSGCRHYRGRSALRACRSDGSLPHPADAQTVTAPITLSFKYQERGHRGHF
jgi:hypothetical protein